MAKADMKKIERDDPEAQSVDLVAENIARLRELFPELITEGEAGVSVNVDVLKQLVGDKVVTDAEEKYGLNWHGKRAARQLALTPSLGTLRPCPEESVDWDTTQNLMIEGDNLEVLKLLQKSYAGKVKLIYIDPPYNTGKDFVYPDNFQDNIRNYLELTGQVEGGAKISSNTEASGRFHTDWLNMMYPRLKIARELLRDDGTIFITIDETEVGNVLAMCNEVFGEENRVVAVAWQKRVSPANDAKWFSSDHDWVIVYAKNKDQWRPNRLERTEDQLANYKNPDEDPRGPWNSATYTCGRTSAERPNLYYAIKNPNTGKEVWPKKTAVWKYSKDVTAKLMTEDRLYWGADGDGLPRVKLFLSERDGVVPRSVWNYEEFGHTQEATVELRSLFGGEAVFDTAKPTKLIERIVHIATAGESDLVVDFFSGSGTTGHAVLRSNADTDSRNRFILVQLPEPLDEQKATQRSAAEFCEKLKKPRNIAELAKERLRRSGKQVKKEHPMWKGDIGFRVFKLDSSNIKAWDPATDNLERDLTEQIDHLKQGRSEQDILYEMLLKLGLDLCVPTETKTIAGKQVHSIGGGVLMACLDKKIDRKDAEKLALGIAEWHKKLNPAGDTTCVFRDSAFADDVAKTNLAAILNQHGITTVRSI